MEPFEYDIKITINEEWFNHYLEKIVKRYIKSPDKRELMLIDLRMLIREANES